MPETPSWSPTRVKDPGALAAWSWIGSEAADTHINSTMVWDIGTASNNLP